MLKLVLDVVEQALPAARCAPSLIFVVAEAPGASMLAGGWPGFCDGERGVLHAEEARPDALGGAADADEAGQGQVLARSAASSTTEPDGRVLRRPGWAAGRCSSGSVPRSWLPSLVTRERTIDRCLNCLARLGQDLADLDAGGRGLDRLELAAVRLVRA